VVAPLASVSVDRPHGLRCVQRLSSSVAERDRDNIQPILPQMYTRRGACANALGLSKNNGFSALSLISPSWADAAQDSQVYGTARSLISDVERRARDLYMYDLYICLDYAAPWQDAIKGYGEEGVEKMRELRRRFKPGRVFTQQVRGGFKTPQ
jgi:hypothetical protein